MLGTYLVLKKIWNPIDFQGQGHRVKFLGKGICHALRCPCFYLNSEAYIFKYNIEHEFFT